MKNTSAFITRTRLLAVLTLSCLTFAFAALPARADDGTIVVSFVEHFTGDTTIDGTFVVGGQFSDKGTRHEDFTVTVIGDQATVAGTLTCTGALGSFTERFLGTIDSVSQQNGNYMTGMGVFTGGTGIYSHISGNATFTLTIDFSTGTLVGVTTGKLRRANSSNAGTRLDGESKP
jgi:hypothetical protein